MQQQKQSYGSKQKTFRAETSDGSATLVPEPEESGPGNQKKYLKEDGMYLHNCSQSLEKMILSLLKQLRIAVNRRKEEKNRKELKLKRQRSRMLANKFSKLFAKVPEFGARYSHTVHGETPAANLCFSNLRDPAANRFVKFGVSCRLFAPRCRATTRTKIRIKAGRLTISETSMSYGTSSDRRNRVPAG